MDPNVQGIRLHRSGSGFEIQLPDLEKDTVLWLKKIGIFLALTTFIQGILAWIPEDVSDYIDVGRFLFWIALLPIGFCYVTISYWGRSNPVLGPNGDPSEVLKLMLLAVVLYCTAARFALASPSSTVESSDGVVHNGFVWNILYYMIPFYMGLQFTHFRMSPTFLEHFKVVPSDPPMEHTTRTRAMILLSFINATGIITIFYVLYQSYLQGNMALHFVYVLGLLLVVREVRKRFHLHHYILAVFVIPLTTSVHDRLVCVLQAISVGILVEGMASWGLCAILGNVPNPEKQESPMLRPRLRSKTSLNSRQPMLERESPEQSRSPSSPSRKSSKSESSHTEV